MEGEAGKGNCLAWAARDPSGILSPYQFDRRAVGSDDVALKIKYCGVCFADVVWTRNLHHDTMYPVVPGHEIAGVVTQVGSNVTQFKVGDNVGVGTYVNTCRNCEHCNEFLEVHCKKGVYTFNGIDYDGTVTKGGYSNHIVVRDRYCFKIPDGYPLELAAPLLCAGITVYTPMMYHKMNQPGKSLGVVGLGGLGHMAVKFGKAFGLNVTVFSTSESKRDEAINILGVDKFVVSSDPQQMQILRRYARARSRSWTRTGNFSELERVAQEAWALGHKAWDEAVNYSNNGESGSVADPDSEKMEPCPTSVGSNKGGEPGKDGGRVVLLPCGLAVGSSITIIGTPHNAHEDFVPQLAKIRDGNGTVMVSQFIVEFQGLKAVDGEEPPKILHLNPRIKGDWSEKPILEHNTCYRMSWGKAMRCDSLPSRDTDETVDGFQKCERWVQGGGTDDSDESKTTSWLNRFIGRAKKPKMTWPFPFSEGRMFVLTIQAGVEGYHINIGGRHISSFPYWTGFTLEDATGLAIKGDVDVHSVFATSLPRTHLSFSPQQVLEMTDKWQARPLLKGPAHLFIGILSATNHFAERMAIRKTWMQYPAIQLGHAVARFFVALSPRKEVNAAMKKEA